jgi:hypothetical protein
MDSTSQSLACIYVHCFTLLLWPSNLGSTWQWERERHDPLTYLELQWRRGATTHTPVVVDYCPLPTSPSSELQTETKILNVLLSWRAEPNVFVVYGGTDNLYGLPPLCVSVLKLFK